MIDEAVAGTRQAGSSVASDADVVSQVDALIADNGYERALRLLEAACCGEPGPELLQRLIDLRIQGYAELNYPARDEPVTLSHDDRFSGVSGMPEIAAGALDAAALRAGIVGQGALLVRGLVAEADCQHLRSSIDRTLAARRALAHQENPDAGHSAWYSPPAVSTGGPVQFDSIGGQQYTDTGSLWTAFSPPVAHYLIALYRRLGLQTMLREYFQEPAVLSVRKWVLRCIAPNNGMAAGWHQDGRFLGDSRIRTVNLWLALNDCGGVADAPGLDIVTGGERTIYDTGTDGADFEWTVGQGLVDRIGDKAPVQCPRFSAGDALFFDHYNLHRTAFGRDHVNNRYAVESWFFAASTAPEKQTPLVFEIPQEAS